MSKRNNSFRVFVDTNVLISAMHSRKSISRKLLLILSENPHLIICSHTLTEVSKVIDKRFPHKAGEWDLLLSRLEFELSYTPSDPISFPAPHIRDDKDIPILVSALIAEPDMLITGDKDFHTKEIQKYLTIYTPTDFLRNFT